MVMMHGCFALLMLVVVLSAAADAIAIRKVFSKACQYGTVGGSVAGQSCSEDACVSRCMLPAREI